MTVTLFGTTRAGQPVHRVRIAAAGLRADFLSLGAILQDLRLDGVAFGLTLGSNDLAAYEGPMKYYGAIVGPVANRIAKARAPIAGTEHRFEANEGATCLHGGVNGTHGQIWTLADHGADFAEFRLSLADGLGGFPGNRDISARYQISAPLALSLTLTGVSDAPTLLNLANHSYWNLDGTPTTAGHRLQVAAMHYTPVNADNIPTGVAPVTGTAFDYRKPRPVGASSPDRIDHNLCLADSRMPLRPVATLTGATGLNLVMETTEPGLQIYDAARNSSAPFPGHNGSPYGPQSGIAIEAQFWPDAPNQPGFPSIALAPGEHYQQVTRWLFHRPG